MRCQCCNNILKPSESTRKFKLSGAYTDMCSPCLSTITDNEFTETVEGEGQDEELFDDEGNPIEED